MPSIASHIFRRACLLCIISLPFFACHKKELSTKQQVVGSWKSIRTITEIIEADQIKESYQMESSEHSFSRLTFFSDGRFYSSGEYTLSSADSSTVVKLTIQKGSYRISSDQLSTKIEDMDKVANMTIRFEDENQLVISSEKMELPKHDPQEVSRYFRSVVTYIRE